VSSAGSFSPAIRVRAYYKNPDVQLETVLPADFAFFGCCSRQINRPVPKIHRTRTDPSTRPLWTSNASPAGHHRPENQIRTHFFEFFRQESSTPHKIGGGDGQGSRSPVARENQTVRAVNPGVSTDGFCFAPYNETGPNKRGWRSSERAQGLGRTGFDAPPPKGRRMKT